MTNPAIFQRTAVGASLIASGLLMFISTILAPAFPGDFVDRLAAIDAAGASGSVSAFTFALAQLPFIVGVLGFAHLVRDRSPLLSTLGGSLAVIGGFGHAVFGGIAMVTLAMATDQANHTIHAGVLETVESGPAVVFMAMGLLGTVLGILLLAIGLFRSHVGPAWVPYALGAFLVIEFVGSALTEWASSVSALLYIASMGAVAVTVWRTPVELWQTVAAPTARRRSAASSR